MSAAKKRITPARHRQQIEAYSLEHGNYETYADALEDLFKNACKVSFPEAFVQTRAKSVSSFAEKAVRRYEDYPDAVNQLTDLCGARVIVQTTEQVDAVCRFIKDNFIVDEEDDKGVRLGKDKVGYRDMHYVVRMDHDRALALGVKPGDLEKIGDHWAEIQVRTWLQHAWADTVHDRIYKSTLKVSSEAEREANLIAALMEQGDRNFNRLANELDGLIANYTALAPREEVEQEINAQELILAHESEKKKRPALAMKLAGLVAAAGNHARVIELLKPYVRLRDANRCKRMLELGTALCRLNRSRPQSNDYMQGIRYLNDSLDLCRIEKADFVPHICKRKSLHAQVLSRLAWALEPHPSKKGLAREYYREAHEHEPQNPYILADMLGFEVMHYARKSFLPAAMRSGIREALRTCRDHALAGIELPYAFLVAGRLCLLLHMADKLQENEGALDTLPDDSTENAGDASPEVKSLPNHANEALEWYARGIGHYLEGKFCVPADALACEKEWLTRIHEGVRTPEEFRWAIELLDLGQNAAGEIKTSGSARSMRGPVLIVSGGADSMTAAEVRRTIQLLMTGLKDIDGTVISGGTTAGAPGAVGTAAGRLDNQNLKRFKLIGYRPERLPDGVTAHRKYDATVVIGDDFQADQILRNWQDIFSAGIRPQEVRLLGFGGGPLSRVEYCIALGLGARVGLVTGFGGTGEQLADDPIWSGLLRLYPLPPDRMTVRAFVVSDGVVFGAAVLEKMGRAFHERYVADNTRNLPANMKPWEQLDEDYRKANFEQAAYAVRILEAAGFGVRKAKKPAGIRFSKEEVELMAELEHGRWNVERLEEGWRPGDRDNERKLHDCLIPWKKLKDGPNGVRKYDRNAVRIFPEILKKAGLEIYRK